MKLHELIGSVLDGMGYELEKEDIEKSARMLVQELLDKDLKAAKKLKKSLKENIDEEKRSRKERIRQ